MGRHKCEVIAYLSSQTQCEVMNCYTVFPLIEAGSLTEAGGSEGEYHRTTGNCASPRSTVVHCVIRAYCVISI